MPDTCANKGVCYEPYDEGILKAAMVRQEYVSESDKGSDWRTFSSSNSVCDCDLTTYTGPTCEEGNHPYFQTCFQSRTEIIQTLYTQCCCHIPSPYVVEFTKYLWNITSWNQNRCDWCNQLFLITLKKIQFSVTLKFYVLDFGKYS